MHLYLWISVLLVILATARAQSETESPPIFYAMPLPAAECGCGTILSKLDQQVQRITDMLNQQKKETESILNGQITKLDQLEQRVSQMLERQQNETESILKELKQELALQNLTQQSVVGASDNLTDSLPTVSNWSVEYVDTQFGPNWIVILHRIDTTGNFERPWKDYRDGFGTVGQHFWLGLEKMHQLTKDAPYELAVEMTAFENGEKRYARYDQFEIGSEDQQYPIVKLGTHSGSAGDGLAHHKSMTFSTYDSGKEISVSRFFGNAGWWFCSGYLYSILTGDNNSSKYKGMLWDKFKTAKTVTKLSSARMMIRAI